MLKKVIRLNLDDLLLMGGMPLAVFVVIHIITACVLVFLAPSESVMLSSVLMLAFSAFCVFGVALGHVMLTFVQCVQFGQTRKRALGLTLGVIGFEAAVGLAVTGLLSALEWAAAPRFWQWLTGASGYRVMKSAHSLVESGTDQTFTLGIDVFLLDWWGFPLVMAAAAAIGIIMAAVLLRFGRKGGWTLWAVWIAGCLGFSRLPWQQYTIVDWLIPLLAAALAAALIWSIWSLLHAAIK